MDQNSLRYFIGDTFGKLSMLSADHIKDHGLILIPLGEVYIHMLSVILPLFIHFPDITTNNSNISNHPDIVCRVASGGLTSPSDIPDSTI